MSKQQTTKYTPLTKCNKVPVELCGPAGCGFVEGVEQCYEKTQTVIRDRVGRGGSGLKDGGSGQPSIAFRDPVATRHV